MRPGGPRAALALAGALAGLAAAAPGASAAGTTLTLSGWYPRAMAFSGDRLVWAEAGTARIDPRRFAGAPADAAPFEYYRVEVSRVRLSRDSRRFAGAPETPVAVRTSIGAMAPGILQPTGDGGFVTVPGVTRFAPPVVRCCDADGLETVIESDGRPDAPVTLAAVPSGARVSYVQATPEGRQLLRGPDPAAAPVATALPAAPGLVAIGGGRRAWVDPASPAALVLQPEADPAAPAVTLPLPGPALRVWSSGPLAVVAARAGARVTLLRVGLAAARPRAVRVWTGRALPRAVAVGGGSVAVSEGRRVRASRSGALRPVFSGRRVIDAVAVDGRRLAFVQRATRKGARIGVVGLGRVR